MIQRRYTRRSCEEYREKRRCEKRLHKRKKKIWENKQLEDIETHRSVNESRIFFQKVNKGRAPYKPKLEACNKEDGTLLTRKEEILERWARHFGKLLNEDNLGATEGNAPDPDDDGSVEPPDLEEVEEAVQRMRNNKAPGEDGLPAELYKQGSEEFHKELYNLIMSIWVEERMPRQWGSTIICPLHKKGDMLECTNYRGISLLSCAYKVLSNILTRRLTPLAEHLVGKYQTGFRRGKSTTDQIFTLRMILEKGNEFKMPTHHLFINFQCAYDSIKRSKLYEAMEEFGIPQKLVRLVKMTMEDVRCRVRVRSECSSEFGVNKGLRQGDALACLLFILALEKVIRDTGIQMNSTIFCRLVQVLGYADDLDLMARSLAELESAFLAVERAAAQLGLKINEKKTRYMFAGEHGGPQGPIVTLGTYRFMKVEEFVYLGSLVTSTNDTSAEIKKRIAAANRCYFGLSRYLRSKHLSRQTKALLYKTLIRPVLMYGSQAWTISKTDERELSSFERKILRRIFGPVKEGDRWRIRRNRELYDLYGEADIILTIKLGRLSWAGHIARMDPSEIPRKIVDENLHRTRRKGRPRLRWIDGVTADARSILQVNNWRAAAQDRAEWRRLIEEAKTHHGL